MKRDQAGDTEMAAQFERVNEHRPSLDRLARAMLQNPEDVHDAVGWTVFFALRDWGRYDSTQPLSGWLHGICHHVCR